MKDLQAFIDKYVKMLPIEGKLLSQPEAERRASEFLVACAHVTNLKHDFGNEKIKASSLERAVYAQVISASDSKKITESKLMAEAHEDYQAARENLEQIDNDINFLKSYYEIFLNAHLFYRGQARDLNQS